MASGQVVMHARYKNNGVRDPGVQGVLIMTENNLDFSPDDPMPSARLNVGFRSIQGQKLSREGSQRQALLMLTGSDKNYTFEFDRFPERDTCRDFVGKVLGKIQATESESDFD